MALTAISSSSQRMFMRRSVAMSTVEMPGTACRPGAGPVPFRYESMDNASSVSRLEANVRDFIARL